MKITKINILDKTLEFENHQKQKIYCKTEFLENKRIGDVYLFRKVNISTNGKQLFININEKETSFY